MTQDASKTKQRLSPGPWLKIAWCTALIPLNTLGGGLILIALPLAPSTSPLTNYLPAILCCTLVLQLISLILAMVSFFGGLAEKRKAVMGLALFGFLFSAVIGYANFMLLEELTFGDPIPVVAS